jgi:hypothetical protein
METAQNESQIYFTTFGQSASLSWYQTTIWNPGPIFLSVPRKISTYFEGFLVCGVLSDEKMSLQFTPTSATGPCQLGKSRIQVPKNLRPYLTVLFENELPLCRLLRLTHRGT